MPCETAHFQPADSGALVAAALACPVCLSSAVKWSLGGGRYDRRASCACTACGHERDVFLTPEQALRLSLHRTCPLDLTFHSPDLLTAL
jgi:hypothetical protein